MLHRPWRARDLDARLRQPVAGTMQIGHGQGQVAAGAVARDHHPPHVPCPVLRRRPADLDPLPFLAATILVGAMANLPFYLADLARGARANWSLASFGAITYFGIFPSVIAYLFWNRGVAEIGPTRAGVFVHLMPVFGTLLAIQFLGETFHAYHAFGFSLILAGIVITSIAERKSMSTNAGTDENTDALCVGLSYCETTILHRLHAGSHAVMDEYIHFFGILITDVISDIKSTDTATNSRGELRDIKHIKVSDPTFAVHNAIPGSLGTQTDRRHSTESGNNNTSLSHYPISNKIPGP